MALEYPAVHEGPPEVDITVVLPVYNEVGHLEEEVERTRTALDASDYTYEIIAIDDGSTDGSTELLEKIDGIRVFSFVHNRGSGSSRKYGTLAARGRYVVWTDADMTYPNDEIPQLVDQIEGYDQVVGARRTEEGTVKILRKPAKWFIRKLASYLTGVKIPDLNSGLRAMRIEVARQFVHLLPRGFSCVTTITMAFLSNGYSVKYVPIDYAKRAGKSKFHWWADTRRYLMQVIRMVLSWNPLKILMPPAGLLFLAGFGKVIYDIFDKDWRMGTNTIVILGAAFSLMLLGMVADLMVQLNKQRYNIIPATRR
ncbi:MAG: glycosyltransferase family 2 protein [Acidimicrobiia bacterium]|nr:glycosyltransferase family 2 protein [Acidimicrobiia bacterium]